MKDRQNVTPKKVLISLLLGIILGSLAPFATTFMILFCNSELMMLLLCVIAAIVIALLLTSKAMISYVYKMTSYFIASAFFTFFIFAKNIYREIYVYFYPQADLNAGFGFGAFLVIPFSLAITIISMIISIVITVFLKIRKQDRRNKK